MSPSQKEAKAATQTAPVIIRLEAREMNEYLLKLNIKSFFRIIFSIT